MNFLVDLPEDVCYIAVNSQVFGDLSALLVLEDSGRGLGS
jgi:hypothetical protein